MVRQPEGLHHLQVNTINSCSLHGWERGKFFTVIRPDIDQAAELVSLFLSCERSRHSYPSPRLHPLPQEKSFGETGV